MAKRKVRSAIELPTGVHHVVARGRDYFYFSPGRNTASAGKPVKLPNDPHAPEFWQAIRQAQGITGPVATDTVGAVIDLYILAWPTLPRSLSKNTQENYGRQLRFAKEQWGALPASSMHPSQVQALMEAVSVKRGRGAANNFLGAMQALSKWGFVKGHFKCSLTEGVSSYSSLGKGHKPWSDAQIKCAKEHLTGVVRQGVFLQLYTGQRGSDVVRLAPNMIDDGGFDLGWRGQIKTGVRPWIPLFPELQEEIETWEKLPGPFMRNKEGGACTRARYTKFFREAVEELEAKGITELVGATLHGLRGTACVRLKRYGFGENVIADLVGMSIENVQRYTRFENKKQTGKAVMATIADLKAARKAKKQ